MNRRFQQTAAFFGATAWIVLAVALPQSGCKKHNPCTSNCHSDFGSKVGTHNGVAAFSNCSSQCISNEANEINVAKEANVAKESEPAPTQKQSDKVYTGMKWQCVEYARRWWLSEYGYVFGSVDTAADMWDQTRQAHVPGSEEKRQVKRLANGSQLAPQVGDLLIYSKSKQDNLLAFGHVAVVVESTKTTIKVAEQNFRPEPWQDKSSYSRQLPLQRTKEGIWVKDPGPPDRSNSILGWLRLRSADH